MAREPPEPPVALKHLTPPEPPEPPVALRHSTPPEPSEPPEHFMLRNVPEDSTKGGPHESMSSSQEVCSAGNTFFVEIRLGRRRCHGLLDTGSEITLLPKKYANLSQVRPVSRTLRAANGTMINVLGEWRTEVTLGPFKSTDEFYRVGPDGRIINWSRLASS